MPTSLQAFDFGQKLAQLQTFVLHELQDDKFSFRIVLNECLEFLFIFDLTIRKAQELSNTAVYPLICQEFARRYPDLSDWFEIGRQTVDCIASSCLADADPEMHQATHSVVRKNLERLLGRHFAPEKWVGIPSLLRPSSHRDRYKMIGQIRMLVEARENPSWNFSDFKIFISHSDQDTDLAFRLTELLQVACDIIPADIRCSHVAGYDFPEGMSIPEKTRLKIKDAPLFIELITPASLKTEWVLFDLGARWSTGLPLIPVIGCGTNAEDLVGPLSGLYPLECHSPTRMRQLLHMVSHCLRTTLAPSQTYAPYLDAVTTRATPRPLSTKRGKVLK